MISSFSVIKHIWVGEASVWCPMNLLTWAVLPILFPDGFFSPHCHQVVIRPASPTSLFSNTPPCPSPNQTFIISHLDFIQTSRLQASTGILKLQQESESSGGLLNALPAGPHPQNSDSPGLGWDLRMCISN